MQALLKCCERKGPDKTLFLDIRDPGNIKLGDLQNCLDLTRALFEQCPIGGSMCMEHMLLSVTVMFKRCWSAQHISVHAGDFHAPFFMKVFEKLDEEPVMAFSRV